LVIFILYIQIVSGQNYDRVSIIQYGYPETYGYVDYITTNAQVVRDMVVNDAPFTTLKNTDGIFIKSVVADDSFVYGILEIIVFPPILTYLIVQNNNNCNLTKIDLENALGQGLALDSTKNYIYFNTKVPDIISNNSTSTFGIARIDVNGNNQVTINQYLQTDYSNWLAVNTVKNQLISGVSLNEVLILDLSTNKSSRLNVCSSPSCAVNITGAFDSINQILYFSDSMGVLSFNLATNSSTRVALIVPVVKGLQVDNQNSILFIQTAPGNTNAFFGTLWALPMHLTTGTANGTMEQIQGSTYLNVFGNVIAVSHCNGTTCGVCGYAYTVQIPTINTGMVSDASLFLSISMTFLFAYLALIIMI